MNESPESLESSESPESSEAHNSYELLEIQKYVKNLYYPYEKLLPKEESFKVVSNGHGVSLLNNVKYVYQCNYKKAKHFGIYAINRTQMNISHSLTSHYSLCARIHSRRFDFISAYQYWTENCDDIISKCSENLSKYSDQYTKEELPKEYNGIKSSFNFIGLQNECALSLYRLGIPSLFPSNFMVKFLEDQINLKMIPNVSSKNQLKILDISAGWGDRLLGACSMNAVYSGCDPNSLLTSCYERMICEFGTQNKQKVFELPFEDFDTDDKFNCLFTSPPFFDLEIYSNEPTQSSEKYTTLDSWLNDFLYVCLKKSDGFLLNGSMIYLHLNDINVKGQFLNGKRISDDRILNYVEITIKWIMSNLKWKFLGNYGFVVQDTKNKESETQETRNEKNKNLLKPTQFIKNYKEGMRCNKNGEIMTQPLWIFKKY